MSESREGASREPPRPAGVPGLRAAVSLLVCAAAGAYIYIWAARYPGSGGDVRGWFASLPPNATSADVCRLLDAKGVEWVRAPEVKAAPDDLPGVWGMVDPFWGHYLYYVKVYIDKDDHVLSIVIEEQFSG